MIYTSHSLEETARLAGRFVSYLEKGSPSNVFGFSGDLGSGKTSFTQAVAAHLGVSEQVTSPTFVIQKRYAINKEGFPFSTLIHMDAYRLEGANELEMLDWRRTLEDSSNLILIEWPEKVIEALPSEAPFMRFSFVSEGVRTIEFPDMMGI